MWHSALPHAITLPSDVCFPNCTRIHVITYTNSIASHHAEPFAPYRHIILLCSLLLQSTSQHVVHLMVSVLGTHRASAKTVEDLTLWKKAKADKILKAEQYSRVHSSVNL